MCLVATSITGKETDINKDEQNMTFSLIPKLVIVSAVSFS